MTDQAHGGTVAVDPLDPPDEAGLGDHRLVLLETRRRAPVDLHRIRGEVARKVIGHAPDHRGDGQVVLQAHLLAELAVVGRVGLVSQLLTLELVELRAQRLVVSP